MRVRTVLVAIVLALLAQPAAPPPAGAARVLQVGPGRQYAVPSQAAAAAVDGDVIEIDAGVYAGDAAVWRADDLTIRGVGGMAHLMAAGANAEGKGIWVIKGNGTRVENIEFSGAEVADRNGAGIRQEGADLTVRNCSFHDNENGILAGDNAASTIVVEYSTFADNGYGDGRTHNMYINEVKQFTLRYSYSHRANVGHNVKSRAARSDILYNRISDERQGKSSYGLDLSNGGVAYVIGNILQQGPKTKNSTLVAYGAEGFVYDRNELYFINNTVVNDRRGGTFLRAFEDPDRARIMNNLFVGSGDFSAEPGWQVRKNLITDEDPGFVDAGAYDYHLRPDSVAINAGGAPGRAGGMSLKPRFQYVDEADRERRRIVRKPDLGAYEH